ncbi:ABC transporter permease [Amycolatopsis sp. H20-H5]|uniref:ABC transporter permease n=1 Tax=Amycolatopsis sp. H20-H5 TaxID=3046309 RepID=UPI002DB9AEA1|nr:ABC transporter permease [Amycolatopsis sp. H20-H5]MEC3981265.1 ABC transporter permease [Amycolatopsis sp. H20-H5]
MTTTGTPASTGRVVGSWHAAWLRVEGHWTWYRRYWTATLYSSGLQPVLFLAAMGLGFGSQVQAGPATGGVSYLQYVAPTLLVSGAMQLAVGEASYPVLSGFKWQKDYVAVTATPVSPGQVLGGQLIWVSLRLALAGLVYLLIALFFGAWTSAGALLVVFVGVLTGLSCAAPVMALAATTHDEGNRFGLVFRFVVMPMTLFAGTFFPITQLPGAIRWIAWISPLWHGNELARAVSLGGVPPLAAAGHLAYLIALLGVGWALAHKYFYRRLVV